MNETIKKTDNGFDVIKDEHFPGGPSRGALDIQVGGSHYKRMKIQPVEFCHANGLDYFQGAVVKYICRFRNKGGKQDLEKVIHFVNLLIELEYGK